MPRNNDARLRNLFEMGGSQAPPGSASHLVEPQQAMSPYEVSRNFRGALPGTEYRHRISGQRFLQPRFGPSQGELIHVPENVSAATMLHGLAYPTSPSVQSPPDPARSWPGQLPPAQQQTLAQALGPGVESQIRAGSGELTSWVSVDHPGALSLFQNPTTGEIRQESDIFPSGPSEATADPFKKTRFPEAAVAKNREGRKPRKKKQLSREAHRIVHDSLVSKGAIDKNNQPVKGFKKKDLSRNERRVYNMMLYKSVKEDKERARKIARRGATFVPSGPSYPTQQGI